jgi:hypothetical protein
VIPLFCLERVPGFERSNRWLKDCSISLPGRLALLLVVGCDGIVSRSASQTATGDGGTGSPPSGCIPDPDDPGSCDQQWTCTVANGVETCKKGGFDIPGGGSAQWKCSDMGEFTQCESTATDAPVPSSEWTCQRDARGKLVCIDRSPDQPTHGGPWTCVYDEVSGVTCTSTATDASGWRCVTQNGTTTCTKDKADKPNDNGGWKCRPQGTGDVCESTTSGESADDSVWSCVPSSGRAGTTCTRSAPDQPASGGPWTCVYDEVNGSITCTSSSSSSGDWVCTTDASGHKTCVEDSPSTPGGSGTWRCYDELNKTVCTGGDNPTNGSWTCLTDEFGNDTCSKSPDYPSDQPSSGGWNCYYDAEGDRICTENDIPQGGCPPGQQRWCDEPTYCGWGWQTCLSDGTWTDCVEAAGGRRPNTDCACSFNMFNPLCCEDRDTCIIPPGTSGRVCTNGTLLLCGTCTNDNDCPEGGICITTNTSESFCGQDCSTEGCPGGYECRGVVDKEGRAYRQCIPRTESCYYGVSIDPRDL